jgi:hypothetical protein
MTVTDSVNTRGLVLAVVALLLLVASPSWARDHYVGRAIDQAGAVIPGATAYVYQAGTTTLATLYNATGGQIANPRSADIAGVIDFYADPATYDIVYSKTGFTFDARLTAGIRVGQSGSGGSYPAITTLDDFTTTDLCQATTGAIVVIGSTPVTLVIDRAVTCTTDRTIPRTMGLKFVPGGILTISTTKTLTINGPFEAPITQQVFSLTGTGIVTFGGASVQILHPQWWADHTIGAALVEDSTAINAALVAAQQLHGASGTSDPPKAARVHLPAGKFLLAAALKVGPGITLTGEGKEASMLYVTTGINAIELLGTDWAGGYDFRVHIENIGVNKVGSDAFYYIKVYRCYECSLEHLFLYGTTGSGMSIDHSSQFVMNDVDLDGIFPSSGTNTGTGLTIDNSSVITTGGIIEFWDTGFHFTKSNSWNSVTMNHPYFEQNITTVGIFDAVFGITIIGGHVTNSTSSAAVVGYSFINGAHHNTIFGGNLSGDTDFGFTPPMKSDATSYHNCAINTRILKVDLGGYGTLPDPEICIDDSLPTKVVTYAATMTFDVLVGKWFSITATSNANRTIAAPTHVSALGTPLTVTVRNVGGGTLGTWTWNAVFKMNTFDKPADGFSRTYKFLWDGTNWIETGRTAADIPN